MSLSDIRTCDRNFLFVGFKEKIIDEKKKTLSSLEALEQIIRWERAFF